ncbi:hypothetical protein C6A87_004470 [Mycobacterium sp. ITM-2016-00317]|uniref:hypothetical protein n=1 Tax=Mycobacterium sp. ITM-2016-00317 TaxID=2099694 RepID=UPI00287F7955|nr:hypothetical protein [Mycobacterium sp. ITM-2016-00317]WNG88502.1 hypothetical protein C6A87_004470 [Mycobacterium sp. ITM-2016-00317]
MTDEIDRSSTHELANTSDDSPSILQDGEMAVCVQSEGLLVAGDPTEVDTYVARIRGLAGNAVDVIDADKASVGKAVGLAAGAGAFLGQSAKFVQLHPDSVKAIQRGQLIPGTDGFYRMMTRGADKKFVSQLQWKQANLNPTRMMSLQMVAVQLALKTASYASLSEDEKDLRDALIRLTASTEESVPGSVGFLVRRFLESLGATRPT